MDQKILENIKQKLTLVPKLPGCYQYFDINGEIIYTPGHSDDSISLILDVGIALVGDLYDLNSAITFNDEKINNSWNKILSHNISKIYYGHHEQNISNIKKISDIKEAVKYVGKSAQSEITILTTYTALLKIDKIKEMRKCY